MSTDREAVQLAYGLLWLHPMHRTSVHHARRMLLAILSKDEQKRGIELAQRVVRDGLPLVEHPMVALSTIAAIAEGSTTANSLPNIAKIARAAITSAESTQCGRSGK